MFWLFGQLGYVHYYADVVVVSVDVGDVTFVVSVAVVASIAIDFAIHFAIQQFSKQIPELIVNRSLQY